MDFDTMTALSNEARTLKGKIARMSVCDRCSGEGRIGAFSYHKGGSCFKCSGTGRFVPSKGRAAAEARALHTRLFEVESLLAAHDAAATSTAELPDLESIDLAALLGA